MATQSDNQDRISVIDGLRGVSILWVIVGHLMHSVKLPLWIGLAAIPQIGVQIFFTISGFVITSLLLREISDRGHIHWKQFLLKRFTKLFPTLLLVVGATAIISLKEPTGCSYETYFASIFFLTELLGNKCWDLSHTWSLSVEEVFYLTWAPAMAFFSRRTAIFLLTSLIALAPLVRVFDYVASARPEYLMFPPFQVPFLSYFDSICFGAISAFLVYHQSIPLARSRLLRPLSVGFSIVLAYLFCLPVFELKGWFIAKLLCILFQPYILALAVSLLLIASVTPDSPLSFRLLCWRPLVVVGRASYSIYLWQQIIANPYRSLFSSTWLNSAVGFTGSVLVGCVCFFFFERPVMEFLRGKLQLEASHITPARREGETRKAA